MEAERIRLEEEAKEQELERMRLEDIRIRELAEIRRQEEDEGKRIVAARLRMLVEVRTTFRLQGCVLRFSLLVATSWSQPNDACLFLSLCNLERTWKTSFCLFYWSYYFLWL